MKRESHSLLIHPGTDIVVGGLYTTDGGKTVEIVKLETPTKRELVVSGKLETEDGKTAVVKPLE